MADDSNPNDVPTYADYVLTIYQKRFLEEKLPPVTTDPNLLEAQAKKAMTPEAFGYIFGGAGEGSTMDANRLAFRQWKLVPRFLRPTKPRDLRVTLFGETYQSPVVMAPVGVQGIFHADRELGVAAACAELKVPYTLSTAATSTIEEVAAALVEKDNAPRWFQLYWPGDNEITASMLKRAKTAGYKVLVVTLDCSTIAWRPTDLDRAYIPFISGVGNAIGLSDPVFRRQWAAANDGEAPEDNLFLASRQWIATAFPGDTRPWEDLKLLRENWEGPIVLKGVLSVEDARLAVEHGMDGIVVSNHGGRQLDGAVASLEVLPEIVDAVGSQITVLFDSGIRTGADIVKALALGARAVMVGRPVVYGKCCLERSALLPPHAPLPIPVPLSGPVT
jgi:lactate 2-monooxygenase